jgi:phosphomethylpyrimidine synthase
MCGPQFCSMRITQDLRADIVADGLKEKAAEFRAGGQAIYVRAIEPPVTG